MKNIKKYLSVALATVLVAGPLAACSGGESEESTTTTTEAEETTEETTEEETEETTEEEAGGGAGEIHVYTRDESSGTRGAFEELIDFEGELVATASETDSNGAMATAVGDDENGIGYVSLTTDFEANNVKPVKYEGVEPSEENVLDESYQLKRPFSYTTRAEDDYESDEVKQLVAAFLDFINNSTEGRLAVALEGGITDVAGGTPWKDLKENHPIVDQDNSGVTIRTAGSTSVAKTIQSAFEAFQPLARNFQFEMNHTGSGDGYKRVLGDEKDSANGADLGFASRDFKEEEDVSVAMEFGVYCQDAVVVVVHADSVVVDLSKDQLYDIFTGAVTDWSEVK